jgi:hypothetical protein
MANKDIIKLNSNNIDLLTTIVIDRIKKYDKKNLTLSIVIGNVIEVVEITKMTGTEKKKTSLLLIEKFINYCPDDYIEFKKTMTENLKNGFISDTIDMVVKSSKQEFNINVKTIVKSNLFKQVVLKCFLRNKFSESH